MLRYWLILTLGGLCEAGWAFCLSKTKGGNNYWYAGFVALYILSAACLAVAARKIPVGTAYAVWTGIGALCTITIGIFIFSEPVTTARLIFIAMIFIAVVGLEIIT